MSLMLLYVMIILMIKNLIADADITVISAESGSFYDW